MDPNEALRKMREAIADLAAAEQLPAGRERAVSYGDAVERMRDHAEALDEWLTRGGFLPTAWAADNRATCCRTAEPASEAYGAVEVLPGAVEDSGWQS